MTVCTLLIPILCCTVEALTSVLGGKDRRQQSKVVYRASICCPLCRYCCTICSWCRRKHPHCLACQAIRASNYLQASEQLNRQPNSPPVQTTSSLRTRIYHISITTQHLYPEFDVVLQIIVQHCMLPTMTEDYFALRLILFLKFIVGNFIYAKVFFFLV